MHTFDFEIGPEAPADWAPPTTVEFQRVEAGNWTETYVFRAEDGDTLHVDLVEGERYRVVVEDANGQRRMLGALTPMESTSHHTLIIGPCCRDDFDNETE